MELVDQSRPSVVEFLGNEDFNLSAGKSLKIESSPQGEEYLDVTVPEGKSWTVHIHLTIVETDA